MNKNFDDISKKFWSSSKLKKLKEDFNNPNFIFTPISDFNRRHIYEVGGIRVSYKNKWVLDLLVQIDAFSISISGWKKMHFPKELFKTNIENEISNNFSKTINKLEKILKEIEELIDSGQIISNLPSTFYGSRAGKFIFLNFFEKIDSLIGFLGWGALVCFLIIATNISHNIWIYYYLYFISPIFLSYYLLRMIFNFLKIKENPQKIKIIWIIIFLIISYLIFFVLSIMIIDWWLNFNAKY